jgi:hypothetical protein
MLFLLLTGGPGSGKSTTTAALFKELTGLSPFEIANAPHTLFTTCRCKRYGVFGKWDPSRRLPGADTLKTKQEMEAAITLAYEVGGVALVDGIWLAGVLSDHRASKIINLEPRFTERLRRLDARGTKGASLSWIMKAPALKEHCIRLGRVSASSPEEAAYQVARLAQLPRCPCYSRKEKGAPP